MSLFSPKSATFLTFPFPFPFPFSFPFSLYSLPAFITIHWHFVYIWGQVLPPSIVNISQHHPIFTLLTCIYLFSPIKQHLAFLFSYSLSFSTLVCHHWLPSISSLLAHSHSVNLHCSILSSSSTLACDCQLPQVSSSFVHPYSVLLCYSLLLSSSLIHPCLLSLCYFLLLSSSLVCPCSVLLCYSLPLSSSTLLITTSYLKFLLCLPILIL